FSSRRRHTRCGRDWSSDVCSSDLGYVAGSALLTSGVAIIERTRVQGVADALIWSTAAIASLGSGVLVAAEGYAALGVLGAILVAVPAWVLTIRRGALERVLTAA